MIMVDSKGIRRVKKLDLKSGTAIILPLPYAFLEALVSPYLLH